MAFRRYDVVVEENELASVEDIRPEIGTLVFEGDIAPIWSYDIDCLKIPTQTSLQLAF